MLTGGPASGCGSVVVGNHGVPRIRTVLSSFWTLKCIVIGVENIFDGAAAKSMLVACKAPTAVGVSLAAIAGLVLASMRESGDQQVRAEGSFSCINVFFLLLASIAARWRSVTPTAKAVMRTRQSPRKTIATTDI